MNLSSQIQLIADKINFDDTNFLKKLEQLISTEESVAFNFMILRSFMIKLEGFVYGKNDEGSSIKDSAALLLNKIQDILYVDDMVITPSQKIEDVNDILGAAFDHTIIPDSVPQPEPEFNSQVNEFVDLDEDAPTQPGNIISAVAAPQDDASEGDAPDVDLEPSFEFDDFLFGEDMHVKDKPVKVVEIFDPSTLSEDDVVFDCKVEEDTESEEDIEAEKALNLKTLVNVYKASLSHNRVRNACYGEMFRVLITMFSIGRVSVSFSDLEYEFAEISGLTGELFISYLNMMKYDYHQDKGKIASAEFLFSKYEKDKSYKSLVAMDFLQSFNKLFDGIIALELHVQGHNYFFKLKKLKCSEVLTINGMSINEIAHSELHSAFYARVANISQPHAKSALFRSISGSSLTEFELADINRNYKEYGLLGLNYEFTQLYDRKFKLEWKLA